jgi:hypothetical protein
MKEMKMWRYIRIALGLYILSNIICAYLFWPRIDQFLRFMPKVEAPAFPAPQTTLEAQQQDLIYLKSLLDYDRSFPDAARLDFVSVIDEDLGNKQALSTAAHYLRARALVALADNGHTGVEATPTFRQFNRSGVDVYPFSDGLFIVRAHQSRAELVGQRLIAVEGRPITDVVVALREYTGGPDNWRDMQSLQILRSPELLHAAGLSTKADVLSVTLEDNTGARRSVVLDALPSASDTDFYYRHAFMTLAPVELQDEGDRWVQTLDINSQAAAPYLEDVFKAHMSRKIDGGLYIQSNYLMSSKQNPIQDLLAKDLTSAPEEGYDFIALDLRFNPGGDFSNAVAFAKNAAGSVSEDGQIYVIVGPDTFSAAIVFTALLKQYAPDRTRIIGQAMGDRPQFWAERGRGSFVLPNSGYWVSYATGYHDWEKGCRDTHEFCFPPNKKYHADIGELSLDVHISPTYSEYASGRDVVMDWVLAQENHLIKGSQK